ncbi:3536_t:CDS:1, partial [Ambispora leptoticha]
MVNFQWPTNRVKTTLTELKSRLRTCFTFPDGTEDEDITISREIGSGKERITTRILNDTDLVNIIWSDSFKGDLAFVVDTSQQPFSSWTFGKMKNLFSLSADSFVDLPKFDADRADTSEYKEVLRHVVEDIIMKHKASQSILSANEATRCEFISSVIYGVASVFNGEVKVCPQYEISGSHGKGPVDWAIKVRDMIIVITEAKREDINQGVGQCTIQLQASMQRNKKRSYDTALREIEMFGIITTASDWVIIKVVSSGVNDDSRVE